MIKNNFLWAGATGLSLLLLGCQTPPQKPLSVVQPTVTIAPHFNPEHWRADGKIALRYPECHGARGCTIESVSLSLEWEHNKQDEKMILIDPLGQEQMRIAYVDGKVHIWENKRERVVSLQDLTKEVGVPLPLDKLATWLTTKQNSEYMHADGWKIQLLDWQGAYYSRIKLQQKDYFLHVLVKNMIVY